MKCLTSLLLFSLVALKSSAGTSEIVLVTDTLTLRIDSDGLVRTLTTKPAGVELLAPGELMSFASVYRGGEMSVASQEAFAEHENPVYRGGRRFPATAASMTGTNLSLEFGEAKVKATYAIAANPHYLAFRLTALEGEQVDRIDLVQLRLRRLPFLGRWIDVAYDDQFGVCLCGGNVQTGAAMTVGSNSVEMRALASRDVCLSGATAVLFGCPEPRKNFLDRMEIVERDFGLPPGARNRRSPVERYSYLWCNPTPENIGEYIALGQRAGFRMLLFSYGAFAKGAGHFQFNAQYPGGIEDLKRVTARIRAAGLKFGLHLHYSKADRTDSYVTPVPDERLHNLRRFTIAARVNERTDVIPVRENPEASTRAEDRRLLKVGKELIAYRDYTTRPPFQFTGCQRGFLNTSASGHDAGELLGLLDVDDWTRFIRFDQETDIQDEAARRIADIANATGPYDLVYFDGAEDVHDPFWYHVASAQYRVYRLLQPAPVVCEAAMSSHFSWHMISGGQAYDLDARHIKNFCRAISCRTAPVQAMDFTRINFGWVFPFSREIGPDALEYVLSRAAGWNCPFSLRISALNEISANPRAEDCWDVIGTWEEARLGGHLNAEQRKMLRTLDPKEYQYIKVWDAVFGPRWIDAWSRSEFHDQEHHLFQNDKGQYELVPIHEIPESAQRQLKAYWFQRSTEPGVTYLLLWGTKAEVTLALPAEVTRAKLMRPFGSSRPLAQADDGKPAISVGSRCYLRLEDTIPEEARRVLAQAVRIQRGL